MSVDKDGNYGFSTKAIHAGQPPTEGNGAIMTPIYQTSTYVQSSPGVHQGYEYARTQNPTRTALEANLAALEEGSHGVCFSSGCAAMDAVLHTLEAGAHVISVDDLYGGTYRLFTEVFQRHGIEFTFLNLNDETSYRASFRPETKLVWIETPTNPLLKLIDIEKVSAIAKEHGALVVVDNTFASPYLQKPLTLGADISLHSSTKYLGGHSDVVGGCAITKSDELSEQLHFVQNSVGAVPAPMDCFLMLRSTKTLAIRMERHTQNAMALAEMLLGRDDIERVVYPGLDSHPQYALAKRQMKLPGGMITIFLSGGLERSKRFLERLQVFSLAESLGGVESLIDHPAIMTHASIPKSEREKIGLTDNLVRLSVGIEDLEDLKADLVQALGGSR